MPSRAASSATRRATAAGDPARVGRAARRPQTCARSTVRSPARTSVRAAARPAGRVRRAPMSSSALRGWNRTSARRCARWAAAARRLNTHSSGCPATMAASRAAGPNRVLQESRVPPAGWSRSASVAKACARPRSSGDAIRSRGRSPHPRLHPYHRLPRRAGQSAQVRPPPSCLGAAMPLMLTARAMRRPEQQRCVSMPVPRYARLRRDQQVTGHRTPR